MDRVAPLAALPTALRGASVIFTPLSPAEGARSSWDRLRRAPEEAEADPFDGGPAREAAFAGLLRQRHPAARIEDPVLDEMRLVKDEQEMAALREAGAICADALTACMRATTPGVMEYQLAGVLEYRYRVSGSRGASYHPIIAGGTNAWYGHYNANDAPLADGDLVLVDCAPDHHYYTSDITRMWPVNGTYSDTQRALYGFMIAYHKALLAGIRPGRTDDEIHREAAQTMAAYLDRTPFANPVHERAARSALEFPHHLSHPVGMAVHDVGHYRGRPLQPGIVFSVDPQMRIPEERLYLRVEDTVVVTADGCENLTARAAGDGRGRNDHARPVHPSAVPVQSPKGQPREAQGAGRFPRVALRSSREIVLAHKHVGRQVPLGRQFPNHCQSERAPTVEHLGRAWLRSDQFGEVLLTQAAGLHYMLDCRDWIGGVYPPVLCLVGFYQRYQNLELVTLRRIRRSAHQIVDDRQCRIVVGLVLDWPDHFRTTPKRSLHRPRRTPHVFPRIARTRFGSGSRNGR